ncbi:MAG: carbohydrate-binding family 9-like protein, partial [Candidatus Hydrogenedentes bacterium]|nr:carbohydrate-binding family 9-like protein [Candidatus Hydrogenedentota bacterium]
MTPEYTAKKASAPPELTGNWSGPVWNAANELQVAHFHPKSSAHRPSVCVRVLHDGANVYLHFQVSDRYVRCTRTDFQSMVCNDSCVEFFVQPKPDKGYFNFEVNAIGTLLVSYIEDHTRTPNGFAKFVRIPWSIGKTVQIYHSLHGIIDPEINVDTEWAVEYAIPRALF